MASSRFRSDPPNPRLLFFFRLLPALALPLLGALGCSPASEAPEEGGPPTAGSTHQELVAFFQAWRELQKPVFREGIPDYTREAMARQHRELTAWQRSLDAFDTTGWSVAEQIDWHLVRAEMNGLDFDHRVLKPWARIPGFYTMIHMAQSDVPAHEGPFLAGWIDTWKYEYPLSLEDADDLANRISRIPAILDQARGNLTGEAHDLWLGGIRAMEGQSADLMAQASDTKGSGAELEHAIQEAKVATDAFVDWLREEAPSRAGPSGVGVENYDWYLKNVHLLPFSWDEVVGIARRELARSHAHLKLEEERNRSLPPQTRISSAAEYDRLLNQAVTDYISFLGANGLLTMRDYIDQALRERIGSFSPVSSSDQIRGFSAR